MKIHYLEFVSTDAEAQVATLEKVHGVSFGSPVSELGNARTADMADGSIVAVRAPMHDAEDPCTRPYFLTEDIEAAVKELEGQGAEMAMLPTESPGRGSFAIYFQGGTQLGLWQLP